jgi:hypothetical protein
MRGCCRNFASVYWLAGIVSCLFFSCSYDYEFSPSDQIEQDRLVVNCILNPQLPVMIHFYATNKTDSGYSFQSVKNVHLQLKENEQILYDAVCPDSVLQLDYRVKAGANYSIEARTEDYERVSAATSIPEAITCRATSEGGLDGFSWYKYLVKLSGFKSFDDESSLWIISYKIFETQDTIQYNELYANNLFLDNLNRVEGMEVLNPVVGSLYFESFLRIKNKNLPLINELVYTPTYALYAGAYEPDSKIKQVQIKLITASKEYDRYNRTLYQQKSMIMYDDDISTIVYQPIPVYSNIKNGLGIFAGMNEVNYYFDLPQ